MSSPGLRAEAARILEMVIFSNRTIDWIEAKFPDTLAEPATRFLVMETLRNILGLRAILDSFLRRPLKPSQQLIYTLMLVGAYKLVVAKDPAYAAINETVEACNVLKQPWAKGLVNGVLRSVERSDRSFESDIQQAISSHWLNQRLRNQYPLVYKRLEKANLSQAPMTLRVNQSRISVDAYRHKLSEAGLDYETTEIPEALRLKHAVKAVELPGWRNGEVAIQDLGGQFAAHILIGNLRSKPDAVADTGRSVRFLDACAAPGGKLCHYLDIAGQRNSRVDELAVEISPRRSETMRALCQRLAVSPNVITADAGSLNWWDGTPFDQILLDAPCSGTGTIRRHPEIQLQLTEAQITSHSSRQLELLHNLWRMLAHGGTLLYCTCSLLEEENDQVIAAFIHQQESEKPTVNSLNLPLGQATRYGWQLTPVDASTDGFYYSSLTKASIRQ